MRTAQHIGQDPRIDGIIQDAQAEVAALRRDLARCRSIFDSARLIVGHEFSKPLTAASGYLELLEDRLGRDADDRERLYISKIRNAFARLEELIGSFVEMLRVENETDDLRSLERIDVRALAEKVRDRFAGRSMSITLNVPADLPTVVARRRCIEVVLENLVSNAVKYGGRLPVVVAAALTGARRDDTGEDLLVLTVEDRGDGIPKDKLEDIFTPFFRLESGGESAGLGLGLTLVKSIVTIIKGEIHVRSKQGEGTTVTVAVPVVRDGTLVPDTVG